MSGNDTGQACNTGARSRPIIEPPGSQDSNMTSNEMDTETAERNSLDRNENTNSVVNVNAADEDDDFTGFTDDFQLVQNKKSKKSSKVSANNGIVAAEHNESAENIVIVKPIGNNAMEIVQNSKARKVALDNSLFAREGIVKVTPNLGKGLFVVKPET